MAKRDSNIDPFNAGEPILPWDDPATLHDDSCTFDDEVPYVAPEKDADEYEAPTSSVSQETPSRIERKRRLAEQRERTAQVRAERKQKKIAARAAEEMSEDVSDDFDLDRHNFDRASAEPDVNAGFTLEDTKKSLANLRSIQATSKKKHKSRALRWVIILLVVFFVLPNALGLLFSVIDDVISDSFISSSDYSSDDDYEYEVTYDIDETAGEEEIQQIFSDRFDQLAENEDVKSKLVADFSEECQESLGYTAEELGVDTNAYVLWLIEGYSYEISSAYCFDGYNGEDPDGSVYFSSTCYDASDLLYSFLDDVYDYFEDENIATYESDENHPQLTDAQQSHIRTILSNIMAKAEIDDDLFNSQQFTYTDDAWVMDEDDFELNLESFFE